MFSFRKISLLTALLSSFVVSAFALEEADEAAICTIIQNYTDCWNLQQGRGFADGFTEDADFVNIFGTKFSGKAEIESRHIKILDTFFKGSVLEITDKQLREVQPGLVIANLYWKLVGFRSPTADLSQVGETRFGIFTQVFVRLEKEWKITASQNTLIPAK